MKKSNLIVLTCAASVMLLFSGCGSSGSANYKSADRDYAGGGYAAESAADYDYGLYDAAAEAYYETESYDGSSGSSGPQVEEQQNQNRKLITTVSITAETEDLNSTIGSVEFKVKELGGYIESSNVYNGSNSKYSTKDANLTVRIPSDRLDEFVESIEGNTNITRKSVNVDDVTLKYVDTESRKNSLKTEEKRLLDIMEKAETVEDIITIEDKLADVRYELESIESQLRSYDNLVDYSTINLSITEVVKYTPVEKEGAFTRMGRGFMESVESVVNGFVELCVALVSSIPQLIVFVLFVVIIVLVIKKIIAISKKNNEKKLAMNQARMAAGYQNGQMMGQGSHQMPAQGQTPVNSALAQPVQGQTPVNSAVAQPAQVQNTANASAAQPAQDKTPANSTAPNPVTEEVKDKESKGDNGDKQ